MKKIVLMLLLLILVTIVSGCLERKTDVMQTYEDFSEEYFKDWLVNTVNLPKEYVDAHYTNFNFVTSEDTKTECSEDKIEVRREETDTHLYFECKEKDEATYWVNNISKNVIGGRKISLTFDFIFNGKNFCELCQLSLWLTSDGDVDNIFVHGPLKEYQLNIVKEEALNIIKKHEECSEIEDISLKLYMDGRSVDRNFIYGPGLKWEKGIDLDRCGRICGVDAGTKEFYTEMICE